MCHTTRSVVAHGDTAVGAVRTWIRAGVGVDYPDCAELADDAVTVASELVSNALEAGASDVVVTTTSHRTAMTVTVADDAPGVPHLLTVDPDQTSGRGLLIVAALGSGWGVEITPGGKNVWADLTVGPAAALGFDCRRSGKG
ncbi:ATP-binding protein [Jatrophihabitans sp. YIM 134969]